MRIAERRAAPCHGLAKQRLRCRQIVLSSQQHAQVVDRLERVWVRIAERRAVPCHGLAKQLLRCRQIVLRSQ